MEASGKSLLSLSLFFLLAISGCINKEEATSAVHFPYDLLRDGDVVFRRGTGIVSRAVVMANKQGHYSHIGIVVKEKGKWMIVHAVPGEPDFEGDPDRVKMDDVSRFFSSEYAKSGALMRVSADSTLCHQAARHAVKLYEANVLFDHEYNLNDSSRMYCTELIDYVYKQQHVDLSEGRISSVRIPGLSGDYLLPSDIQQSSLLCMIYNF